MRQSPTHDGLLEYLSILVCHHYDATVTVCCDMPTLRGPIEVGVNAINGVQRCRGALRPTRARGLTLLLDRVAVASPTVEPYHLYAENVGCPGSGAAAPAARPGW